ncbi:glycosyltransferase family protein [Bacillus pumilus]|uniref:glycosyltransferase family protein n=1 Tax=Bacillus pumilus TaxID=1408 RepID=UPI0011E9798F|nr:glycosyltransferase family protein [Bacillus pumilus]TYS32957.1 streptomycin biosynthesis protein StrF [Bacillus pumilus]TYS50660.1 streptomycin biosynthesis protein StrF [Bacillus pumilus]
MSNSTILFVLCVNDESMFQACFRQLASLPAPHGYHVEVLPIRHASSMTSAYNEAISHPAQFKIYLHQDTLIVKQQMLLELIPLFLQHPSLGMVGVIGAESVPDNGIWWESADCRGKVIEYRHDTYQLLSFERGQHPVAQDYINASAIDGLFMATQYDVKWREDLFDGFHFYDVSQSLEFVQQGYKVGIAKQEEPWCIHKCGDHFDGEAYEKARQTFLSNYR